MPPVYIAILTHNDHQWLPRFLPGILETAYPAFVVWILDNGSSKPIQKLIETQFSKALESGLLRYVYYAQNKGYAGGYQAFFEAEGHKVPYLALLNSDVAVTRDWLRPLIARLEESPPIAAVQPKIRSYHQPDFFEYAGGAGGLLDPWGYPTCRGRLGQKTLPDQGQYETPEPIFWASGAALVVRTEAIRQALGGLLLKPYYFMHMEEIDLCWRLQRAGYQIWYEPTSTVYHVGGASLPASSPDKTYFNFRNNLYLLAENLHPRERWLLLWRLILDGVAGLFFLLKGRWRHTFAILRAHLSFYAYLFRGKFPQPTLPYKHLKALFGVTKRPWILEAMKFP